MDTVNGLTTGGWVFLIAAWLAISVITVYCYYKVIKLERTSE